MAFDGRLISGVSVFVAVVDTGTFLKAGDVLGLTKSGVSRAIARLETRLNLILFDRGARGVSLTREGRSFYERMAPLLDGFKDVADEISRGRSQVQGRIRVNCDTVFGNLLLAPRLGALLDRFPRLSVELVSTEQPVDLLAERFDLAIRFGPPETFGAVVRPLMAMPIATCAAPSYLARKGVPASPEELCAGDHDFVRLLEPSSSRPTPWRFRRDGELRTFDPARRLMVNHPLGLRSSMLGGAGIGQLLDFMVREDLRSGALVRLFDGWEEEPLVAYVYLPSHGRAAPAVEALVQFAEDIAEAQGPDLVALGALQHGATRSPQPAVV
ncbi:LysR family transcriptional regulator [Caulobacter radicis]|uniref:LysR family transcriptional regulator n=1 Tax=Caulobacter radicis TaxID=2172650 RepID=A0A2T9IYU5_9CAUL|nr:LysR family transcriptional regulator [Caulobacter radicis]